jgi:hypothetical protein
MKNLNAIAVLPLLLTAGCIMPNFNRIIPENKDANVLILSPMYGQVIIQTRVNPAGSNPLPALTPDVPAVTVKQQ